MINKKHQITTRQIESQASKLQNVIGLLHPHTEIANIEEAEHSIKTAEVIISEVIKFLETRKGED